MKTSLIGKPDFVEDVRGRPATARNAFKGIKSLIPDTQKAVKDLQDRNFVTKFNKMVKRVESKFGPESPEEAVDRASTKANEARQRKKESDQNVLVADLLTREARKEISAEYQKAVSQHSGGFKAMLAAVFANGKGKITRK